MLEKDLIDLISTVVTRKTETPNIELKAARNGEPEKLYDSLSSFSNTKGGVIIFGIDEKKDYEICGVKNPDILEKKVVEQSNEMTPIVRPLITFCEYQGQTIMAAEIAELDVFLKPCYYTGKGKSKGSYIRVGDADLPMTEYEIYSYESFRQKKEDELRTKERISKDSFDTIQLDGFLAKAVTVKPNLINIPKDSLMNLIGFTNESGYPTICGLMLFGKYPQIVSPNLDIVAVKNSGTEYAKENDDGIRFIDNKRLDGTIPQMLNSALQFVQNNMKKSTVVDSNGQRKDVSEYPVKALREIILNALIHRDYSYLTENDPIRIEMYSDRIEISNPGGLYGRLTLDDLGKARADVRNPFIASALEILETTENRYSGIPTIRSEMEKAGLMPPRFDDVRGTFKVTLYNSKQNDVINSDFVNKIKHFCKKPRTKEVLAKEFGYDEKHPAYFMNNMVKPLIDQGILRFTIPDKPKSKNQRIITVESE